MDDDLSEPVKRARLAALLQEWLPFSHSERPGRPGDECP